MAFIPSSSSSGGTAVLKQGFASRLNRRACYFMIAYQNNGYHIVFYDQDFNAIIPMYYSYNSSTREYESYSNMFEYHSGIFMNDNTMNFAGMNVTSSTPSSSNNHFTSSYRFNGSNGCSWIHAFSDGSVGSQYHGSYTYSTKLRDMKTYFTSDHTNRSIIYGYSNGKIYARHINAPSLHDTPYVNTESYAPTAGHMQIRGTAAYNNTLKELHLVYDLSTNQYQVRKFTNWDFDAYPDPTVAAANATHAFDYAVNLIGFTTSNNESKYNSKMLLRDDGQLHMYTFFTSSKMANHYWTNPTASATISATQGNTASNTTSYGYEQGEEWGQHIISSRDGKNYAFISPYYYYQSGLNTMYSGMKETSNGPSVTIQNQNSSVGLSVLPWRDDGFCTYYASNSYASNSSGSYLFNFTGIGGTEGRLFTATNNYKYLPLFHGANTTSYPGIACVNDYRTFKYDERGMGRTLAFNDSTIQ